MILETCYILIWSSGVVCVSTILYNLTRNYAFVTVNCWFCNTDLKIPFKNRKEWFCVQCNQFNGFKADGDYSRILPEQFDEALNRKYVSPAFRQNEYVFNSNGLCSLCNANQELKMKQLALYVPFQENNYDEEIEIFRNKLETAYKLCEKCESFVFNKLQLESSGKQFANGSKIDATSTDRSFFTSKYFAKSKMLIILIVVVGMLAGCIFKTDLVENRIADILKNCEVERVFLRGTLQLYWNFVLDCIFALSTAFLPRVFLKSSQSVVGILLVIFSSMISEDLVPLWKIFAASTIILAIVVRYISKERLKKRRTLPTLNFSFQNRFDVEFIKNEQDEYQKRFSPTKLTSSTSLYNNVPLCGQFSDMHLGKCEKYASHLPRQSSAHSFKCDRLLIQPPKLKIEDSNHTDTLRTSPTASSGYQSLCGGFFKRTCDSDSEFDSISQVDIAAASHSFSNISKSHSPLPRFLQQSRFRTTDALSSSRSSAECYYGAMPVYSSATARFSSTSLDCSNEKSQLRVDASIPTFQIVLYSITCFVLGFSFQIFIRECFV